ncbi:MAG: PQQ-binding-like beta-propeller repeat protein [Planctomyces sp.]|nr:PQQ-binding-like beta-propeller repeat protein [Planctomyces sp.]
MCGQSVRLLAVVLALLTAALAAPAKLAAADDPLVRSSEPGQDWPCFLGPHSNGVSDETGLLETWPEDGPPLIWAQKIGEGYGAPSVLGQRLVQHHYRNREEVVECFHAVTGESLWTHRYRSNFRDPYGYNNGPRCSPVLTPEHCYTFGAEGVLLCLRLADGEVVWRRDTQQDFTVPEGFFGVGSSPLLLGDRLIVMVGGQPNSGVVAFRASDGATLWESVGQATWDGIETGWPSPKTLRWSDDEAVVSYSSPVAATIHGQEHVFCLMRHGLASLDPKDGRVRFRYWFRSRVHESVNAAAPVVVDDTVMISSEYRTGSARLRIRPDGDSFDVLWRNPRGLETHWSTAIEVGGAYYGFSGHYEPEGRLTCIDAATGDVHWESPGYDESLERFARVSQDDVVDRRTGEKELYPVFGRGSLLLAEGKLIGLAERGGMLALMSPSTDGRKEISRCRVPHIGYPAWAAPVLSRGRLYLRSQDWLVCLDLRKPAK